MEAGSQIQAGCLIQVVGGVLLHEIRCIVNNTVLKNFMCQHQKQTMTSRAVSLYDLTTA